MIPIRFNTQLPLPWFLFFFNKLHNETLNMFLMQIGITRVQNPVGTDCTVTLHEILHFIIGSLTDTVIELWERRRIWCAPIVRNMFLSDWSVIRDANANEVKRDVYLKGDVAFDVVGRVAFGGGTNNSPHFFREAFFNDFAETRSFVTTFNFFGDADLGDVGH